MGYFHGRLDEIKIFDNALSESEIANLAGTLVLGDVNGDGQVDLLDVAPFVNLLTTGDFQAEADINQDGTVDLLDVQPFVNLLAG